MLRSRETHIPAPHAHVSGGDSKSPDSLVQPIDCLIVTEDLVIERFASSRLENREPCGKRRRGIGMTFEGACGAGLTFEGTWGDCA